MQNCNQAELLITGIGVTAAIGQGKAAFASALLAGRHAFGVMQRPGRPFDRHRDGFIFGESCGVLVIERAASISRLAVQAYARLAGWAIGMDGNRNAAPSRAGEIRVIQKALQQAHMPAPAIDYINPHGTGSIIGDKTELGAIRHCGLDHAYLNASKSILGHGLSSAGTLEVIATLLQIQASRLHPTLNLDDPIEPSLNWVREHAVAHRIKNALTLSIGFGGINTALCLQHDA